MNLILGDCLEKMKGLGEGSIDMVLCDLPYQKTGCKWDKMLPFDALWTNYNRLIKANGVIVLTACQPFTSMLVMSNLKMFRYEWIWEKTQATGFFNAKIMPMVAHEHILVFYKKLPVFNPQKTYGHSPMHTYTKRKEVCNRTEIYGKVNKDVSGGGNTHRYPRSVLTFSSDKQKTKLDGTIHPTQKPVALFCYFIKTYTNTGDLVLDNCMGSGTTGVACKMLGRDFIGIEKEENYFEIAEKRIKATESVLV